MNVAAHPGAPQPRAFELAHPDLQTERAGNTGTEGVWRFESGRPGRQVLLTALIHGNELCGAWALKELLAAQIRPCAGTLTVAFCNLAAYDRFDATAYGKSRFVDEDMNRIWSSDKLAIPDTCERRRALDLLPWFEPADWLMDFHSMSQSDVPLQLTGLLARNIALGLALGNPATIVADAGHASGTRLRDYGRFGDPLAADTRSLLIECGFHGAPEARDVAIDQMARFLRASGCVAQADLPSHWFAPDAPVQQALRVTEAIAAQSGDFRFSQPWQGLEKLAHAGTVIGWSDGVAVTTPYDDCVLIMPSLNNLRPGNTVVRLAQPIS